MRAILTCRATLVWLGCFVAVSAAACTAHPASDVAGAHAGSNATSAGPKATSPGPAATASSSSAPVSSTPPAAAWLMASEMPFNSTHSWSLFAGNANSAPIGTPEGNGVYYVSPNTVFQAITTCGDPSLILGQPLGAWQRIFKPTSGDSLDQAGQWISSYPDATAAQAAWQQLRAAYAGCLAQESNPQITLTETSQTLDTMAWFHSTNGETVGSLAPYSHEYFALHQNEISYVYVEGGGSALATTPDDSQVLATIARHLNG